MLGEQSVTQVEQVLEQISYRISYWILTEEAGISAEKETYQTVFRYQKAGDIIRRILLSETEKIEYLSVLYTVFSPENNQIAIAYVEKLIEKFVQQGKTLILFWDSFLAYGREETGKTSISEMLYLVRKDKVQARKLFEGLPKKSGAEYFCGPDYCTDLWQYSAQEMQQLIRCCQEYGAYQYIVFMAGIFHEGVIAVMNQSSQIYLVSSNTKEGEGRKQEFYRQMKYAGEQEILSKVIEVEQ